MVGRQGRGKDGRNWLSAGQATRVTGMSKQLASQNKGEETGMFLPSTGPHFVQVNHWNQEAPGRLLCVCFLAVCFVFASWLSASIIPRRITGDSPTQSWRTPSLNRAAFGSRYIWGSTASCEIAAEAFQWQSLTMENGVSEGGIAMWVYRSAKRFVDLNAKYPWNRYYTLILLFPKIVYIKIIQSLGEHKAPNVLRRSYGDYDIYGALANHIHWPTDTQWSPKYNIRSVRTFL